MVSFNLFFFCSRRSQIGICCVACDRWTMSCYWAVLPRNECKRPNWIIQHTCGFDGILPVSPSFLLFCFHNGIHLSALYNTTVISILLSIPPQLCCVWKTRLTSDSDYSKSIQSVRVERVRALLCHSYISVARVSLHSLISFFYYHNYCHSTTGRVRATALENKPLFQEQNNSRCLLDIFRFILLFFFQVAHGGKETWRSDGCRANHFNMLAHPSSCFFYIFSSLLFVHSLRVSSVDFYFTLCIRGNQMYDQRKVPERRHGQDCAIHTYSIRCVT